MCRALHCGIQIQLLLGSEIKALPCIPGDTRPSPQSLSQPCSSVGLPWVRGQGATSRGPKSSQNWQTSLKQHRWTIVGQI